MWAQEPWPGPAAGKPLAPFQLQIVYAWDCLCMDACGFSCVYFALTISQCIEFRKQNFCDMNIGESVLQSIK